MGLYNDSKVLIDIETTHRILSVELMAFNTISTDNLDSESQKDYFLKSVLLRAWREFYLLVKENQSSLDENTGFNQNTIPSYIKFDVDQYNNNKVDFLYNLLRVMREYYFWTGGGSLYKFLDYDVLSTLHELYNKSNDPHNPVQFKWIRDELPVALIQWMLNGEQFIKLKSIVSDFESIRNDINEMFSKSKSDVTDIIKNETLSSIKAIKDSYYEAQKEINNKGTAIENLVKKVADNLIEIEAYEKRVSDIRSEYNFVGLSSGFNKIKEKKESELNNSEIQHKNLFGCVFIAPIITIALHFMNSSFFPKDFSALFVALPFVTIELVLVYFFRLSYLESKAIRTQLIQIELRLSLCAFIDGYVDYRKKNNLEVANVLNSFDSLIFSPIQINDSNIPSMFDGTDALADLAGKIMKNK
ncbi:hypothetical protein ACIPUP_00800 [Pectobacterium actinidiae]|uniref:Uncharacterized protein n=1 Tax=Pectobacterium actinidiae TaxID=1507808 RepID=A0ABW8G4V4_9GAMM